MRSFLLQSCSNSIHWYRIKTKNPQRPQRCWGFFVTMGRNYSFETKMRWVKLRFLGLAGIHYDIRWLLLWAIAAARLNYISIYYVFVARHLGSDRIEINPRISTRGIVANINAHICDDIIAKCYPLGVFRIVYPSRVAFTGWRWFTELHIRDYLLSKPRTNFYPDKRRQDKGDACCRKPTLSTISQNSQEKQWKLSSITSLIRTKQSSMKMFSIWYKLNYSDALKRRGLRNSSPFCTKLVCGDCGSFYGHKIYHAKEKHSKDVWYCNHRYQGSNNCSTPILAEDDLVKYYLQALSEILEDKDKYISACRTQMD